MDRLIDYAMKFVGIPYKWGGDNPIDGFDCSGFMQELLQSVGIDPPGDQTANVLHRYFSAQGTVVQNPQAGALVFYGTLTKMTHIAMCIDSFRIIEAGGGGSNTLTWEDAAKQAAYIRIRPIRRRKDLQAIIMPRYPAGMGTK